MNLYAFWNEFDQQLYSYIQENWKFVIICVQNQWGVVHPWHGTVANLWGRHKDFTEFNENFEKSYLLNGLSNIVKFFTVWFLKIFCIIKWIHIFFWVLCSFKLIKIYHEESYECKQIFYYLLLNTQIRDWNGYDGGEDCGSDFVFSAWYPDRSLVLLFWDKREWFSKLELWRS